MAPQAQAPCGLTIRHSRFATLTLAKLVASLALHPPVSATEADYAPHHRLRRSLSSRRSLLVSASANYRHPPCLIIKPPWQRTAQLDAGRAQHDRRGNIQGDGWRLRRSGHENFSCHGRAAGGQGHSQLKTSNFTSHTGSLLLSSLKKVTFPRPLFPSPLRQKQRRGASSAGAANNV